jgi:hypothetical protein
MKKMLYLLRKPVDQIDSAVFLPSESRGDVVLLAGSGARMFPYAGGAIFSLDNAETDQSLTYDALVEKIFECDRTMVI